MCDDENFLKENTWKIMKIIENLWYNSEFVVKNRYQGKICLKNSEKSEENHVKIRREKYFIKKFRSKLKNISTSVWFWKI